MGIESNRELFSVACVFFVKSQLESGLAEASSPILTPPLGTMDLHSS